MKLSNIMNGLKSAANVFVRESELDTAYEQTVEATLNGTTSILDKLEKNTARLKKKINLKKKIIVETPKRESIQYLQIEEARC